MEIQFMIWWIDYAGCLERHQRGSVGLYMDTLTQKYDRDMTFQGSGLGFCVEL